MTDPSKPRNPRSIYADIDHAASEIQEAEREQRRATAALQKAEKDLELASEKVSRLETHQQNLLLELRAYYREAP